MPDSLNSLLAQLKLQFADRLLTSDAAREHHGSGESHLPPAWPDAVVIVQSTQEVSDVLAACTQRGVPVIPFGAGSSIEGQIHAPHGGVSLDVSAMDTILSVQDADMDCTVQCGVTRQAINEHIRATGLFFPIDLGAHATLGGMAATRASGTTTVRYGWELHAKVRKWRAELGKCRAGSGNVWICRQNRHGILHHQRIFIYNHWESRSKHISCALSHVIPLWIDA